MPRIRLEMPTSFSFSCVIPVRITDINYGGHVGNDSLLSIIHEARMQYLNHFGYAELALENVGLIMADVAIEFKKEIFYGQTILAEVQAADFGKLGFDVYYRLSSQGGDGPLLAHAKTGMLCYDYTRKKPVAVPDAVREKLGGMF